MNTNHFHGCVVLSSRQSVSLPLFSRSVMNEHIEGSFNGSVGTSSSFSCEVYDPARGRSYHGGSAVVHPPEDFHSLVSAVVSPPTDALHGLRDAFHTAVCGMTLPGPTVLHLEQRSPFGFVCLHSHHVDLHFFGLYNQKCSVLYWSTVDNIEEVLRTECPNEFWIHRFRPVKDMSLVLYVKRLCSRWYRWNDTLSHPSQKFQALETSILNSVVHNNGHK